MMSKEALRILALSWGCVLGFSLGYSVLIQDLGSRAWGWGYKDDVGYQ